mgnify:CR=1 FL=1
MNKEFFELTNYMGGLESKLSLEQMIRDQKLELQNEKDKEAAM